MRRERNRLQDEWETVSRPLQQEHRQTQRLEAAVAAALQSPRTHHGNAYRLRKLLRAIMLMLEHPQAKDTAKLKRIAKLVAGALDGEDEPATGVPG